MKKLLIALLLPLALFGVDSFQADYKKALSLSLEFYDAQGAGERGEAWRRATWRKASTQSDGADVGADLSGGWFDAGDHVKFTLPMSYSATMLNWGYLEYRDGYALAGEEGYFRENIRVALDFLLNAYSDNGSDTLSDDRFYYQVGDGGADHSFWGPPELMSMSRPTYTCDKDQRCTEAIAGSVAALASGAMVFEGNDTAYASRLLTQAKKLFAFTETYQGNNGYTAANGYYTSFSGYYDELSWAAIWLYMATGESIYLDKSKEYIAKANDAIYWAHNWDNVSNGTYLLLLKSGESSYENRVQTHLDYWIDGVTYTPAGLAHLSEWGSLRYASTTAFLGFVYSDFVADTTLKLTYRTFAINQMNYILGNNPTQFSYLIGLGSDYPRNPHHRAAHNSTTNSIHSPTTNTYRLNGALVGGPKVANDYDYVDDREDYYRNEVATDYNAAFTGALAKMALLNPSSEAVTPSQGETTEEPDSNPVGTVSIVRQKTEEWSDGYCEEVAILNSTSQPYVWEIDLGVSEPVYHYSDAEIAKIDGKWIAKGLNYNASVPSNGRVAFVYCAGDEPEDTTDTPTALEPPVTVDEGELDITRYKTADWQSGYCEIVVIQNSANHSIIWDINIEVEGTVYELWNAIYSQDSANLNASGVQWNSTIEAGLKVEFGFCSNKTFETLEQSEELDAEVNETIVNMTQGEALVTPSTLNVTRLLQADWTTGYCEDIIIKNPTNSNETWRVELNFEGEIYTIWNSRYDIEGEVLKASGVDWNAVVTAQSETSFGFCANR